MSSHIFHTTEEMYPYAMVLDGGNDAENFDIFPAIHLKVRNAELTFHVTEETPAFFQRIADRAKAVWEAKCAVEQCPLFKDICPVPPMPEIKDLAS